MQKINFQDLPNTTTPINATNLNAVQTNVEDVFNGNVAMGSINVSSITSTGNATINGKLNYGTELFNGSSNNTDIQLSDSINNYTYLEIVAGSAYGGIIAKKFQIQYVLSICLSLTEIDLNDTNNYGLVIGNCKYTLDGTYLRYNGASRVFKYENGGWVQDRNNPIYVYKVIGYK